MSDDRLDGAKAESPPGTYQVRLEGVEDDGPQALTLPVKALSPSSIGMYLRCPRQFYFRYVLGQKKPPGIALVEGTSHHNALAKQNQHKIETHEDLPAPKVIEVFEDQFSTLSKDVEEWEGEDKDSVITRGRKLLGNYMKHRAPALQPIASEQFVETKIHGIPVLGYIDVLTKNLLLDYKIASSRSPYRRQTTADKDFQLSFYSYAAQEPNVGFEVLIKDNQEIERVKSKRTAGQYRELEDHVVQVARAISAGAFPMCAADSWLCTPRFCGWHSQCRGRYK